MSTISHTELKKRAVLTTKVDPSSGKVFNNNGIYKVWNGRTYINLGEEDVARMYDDVTDFPAVGKKGLLYRLRVENHFYAWDGKQYNLLGDSNYVEEMIREFSTIVEQALADQKKPTRDEALIAFKTLPNFDWTKNDTFYIRDIVGANKMVFCTYIADGAIDELTAGPIFFKDMSVTV